MNEFDQLVKRHLELQARVVRDAMGLDLAEVEELLAETRAAGREVAAVEQREHLRAILRYWGAFIYEKTGEYPATQLAPYAGESDPSETESITMLGASAGVMSSVPTLTEREGAGSTATITGTAATPAPRPNPLTNPLSWVLILGVVIIVLIILVLLSLIPIRANLSPSVEVEATGVPLEVLGNNGEEGDMAVIDVTRPSETSSSGIDFILTVRPQATLQELATDLKTSVETLQDLNPSLTTLPVNGTLLVLVGQPVPDAHLVVTSSEASAREQPARQAQVIVVLPSGTFAAVLGRTTDYRWYWVDMTEGKGWLSDQDVGLIYPTVPDGLPVIAKVQIMEGTPTE